jgi:hypothetical protein
VKHAGDASGTFIPRSLYVFYLCHIVVEEGVNLMYVSHTKFYQNGTSKYLAYEAKESTGWLTIFW